MNLIAWLLVLEVLVILFFLIVLSYWFFSRDAEANFTASDTALGYCQSLIAGFKKKAKREKNHSMLWFIVTMLGSLVAPLCVSLGDDNFYVAKLIPSILSATVAFGTAWLQLKKPQHLWALYRGCQRRLEDNLAKYKFKVDEYASGERDVLLAKRCAEIAMDAHNEWLPIMPKGENIGSGKAQ